MADKSLAELVAEKQDELDRLQRERQQSAFDAQQSIEDARLQRELNRLDAAIENEKALISAQDAANEMASAVNGVAPEGASEGDSSVPVPPAVPVPGPDQAESAETPGGVLAEDTVTVDTSDAADDSNDQEGEGR